MSGTYDFNTGVFTSFTNENATQQALGNTPGDSQHTSLYSYDYLFRMTLAQGPADPSNNSARPQNQFSYSAPNTFPLSVQRQKAITSTVNDVSTALFDGLGRPYQTQHVMPAGTAKIDTTYDPLSQVVSVSNPYFTTSDSTYGAVQNTYDALGRVTQTTKQDGSVTTADYHEGNCVTSTDEAGKNRRACSDALGRLTSVDEPGDTNATASPILGTGGSQALGTVTIAGAEQSKTVTLPPSTGGGPPPRCPPHVICDNTGGGGGGGTTATLMDYGTVAVSLRGRTYTASFGTTNDTPTSIAAALASAINADISIGVTASSSNGTLYVLSMASSSGANYPLTVNYSWDSADFPQPSFVPTASGMSGGSDGNPIFGGHTYTTLYSYDALGNLLQVQQQGGTTTQSLWRVRTFTYDSLSRMLTSNNPETGQISYSYDADGNLISKTDARGTVATYTYDALHRITGKSFSEGTRGASYTYDINNAWGVAATNTVGRLVLAYDGNYAGTLFSYDVMGHVNEQWDCPPSAWLVNHSCYTVNAQYNLAGDLTKLIYPDNRVVNYGYNSGDQLDSAQLSNGYTYWSVADTNFYPNGTAKQVSFGNGVSESTTLNPRLQLQEETINSPGIGTLADHSYNYGAQNNGNILSVFDLLNPSRTQNFSHDQLNRLATAGEQGGRWGLSFGYDPWGNFLQQNVTAGSAGMHSYQVAANNRLTQYSYDAAGNMLGDGFHNYTFDAESRISQVDGGATVYTYDPSAGDRVRKDTGTNYTEYFYFGSEILAERDQNLRWSDYIFANGKRIARADGYDHQLHLSGQMCGNCGWQWYQWGFSNLGSLVGHVVQAGDKLRWRQWSNTGSKGGLIMTMTDGTETWMNGYDILDQHGEEALRTSTYNQWNYRIADLSPLIGKTVSQIRLIADGLSTPGQWDMWVEDVVYTQTDGTVQPLFSEGATVPSLYTLGSSGWTNTAAAITDCTSGCAIANTTTYYHEDQIKSSRLISNGYGYPIWQATFLPYGEEYGPQIGANHYKFSGKERDSESGLDYFGARYYGSALGRFITPDWAAKATAVPYAEFADPQSLNLYTYVRNIPTTTVDNDGHERVLVTGPILFTPQTFEDIGHAFQAA